MGGLPDIILRVNRPAALLLLAACSHHEEILDSAAADSDTTPEVDLDGDGFLPASLETDPALVDCDDGDASVGPTTEQHLPAGSFWRGTDEVAESSPMRDISLSAYCLDRTEVTNAAFVAFLEARAAAGAPNVDDAGHTLYDFEDDDDTIPERIQDGGDGSYTIMEGYEAHPVTEVPWEGAVAYCAWRGQVLPTEARWERGARGDDDSRTYPWGEEEPSCELGNIRPGPEGVGGADPCVDDTVAVGGYPGGTSPWGLVDMAGNVAEWVMDWYDDDYYADSPDADPPGAAEPTWVDIEDIEVDGFYARVSRGGSYASGNFSDSVWFRYIEPDWGSSNGVGFRCAREQP